MSTRIGIDAGGTFTDFLVVHPDGRAESFKLRSNPRAPARVILAGLERIAAAQAEVVHGSTVATNALLERKGVRTALVTTEGFTDITHIGRQNRAELYNLTPPPRRYLIPREHCFGIRERTYYDGAIALKPSPAEIARVRRQLEDGGFESVAICFLHAYQNPDNEREVRDALGDGFYLCSSHDICPEFREYERASTTLLNAYVGPLMDRYLAELEAGTLQPIAIMQSSGGLMTAAEARRYAVRTLLSGPAGGVIAASEVARRSGFARILGFDMGGTSTDVSLCDGAPRLTAESSIDGFPIRLPLLDIHTVGAGGGSLARVDEGGLLRVGPESAGAVPGPACYGEGSQATVTDAHVVLGRIAADQLAGGSLPIEPARSAAAVDAIAAPLGLARDAAAAGIIRVANANMERAIRAVSVERGYDPHDFALVAFGGGGGLHACEMAEELRIDTVLVPPYAGALSALGMLLAHRVRDYAAGVLGRADLEERFLALEDRARREMPNAALTRSVDVRYAGQSYELTIPWRGDFHEAHRRAYGYADPARSIEYVAARVRAQEDVPPIPLDAARPVPQEPAWRRIYVSGRWRRVPVFHRESMPETLPGPALILDYGSTTLVPVKWTANLDHIGALVLTRSGKLA